MFDAFFWFSLIYVIIQCKILVLRYMASILSVLHFLAMPARLLFANQWQLVDFFPEFFFSSSCLSLLRCKVNFYDSSIFNRTLSSSKWEGVTSFYVCFYFLILAISYRIKIKIAFFFSLFFKCLLGISFAIWCALVSFLFVAGLFVNNWLVIHREFFIKLYGIGHIS